jgi:hypothetical protein
MAVSKHNLWKRTKSGLMKLVRSNKVWKKQQNLGKALKKHENSPQRVLKNRKQSINKIGGSTWMDSKSGASSAKRTQVGKKI